MTFYVENETDFVFPFDINQLIEDLTKETLRYENVKFSDVCVNVSFCDDEEIKSVNSEFRNIDNSTDVLSFPAIDTETLQHLNDLTGDEIDYFDPETHELILGDILISVEHVQAQAELYNHSIKRETAFLIAHSLLHLLGYDHMEDSERKIMEDKQEEILSNLHITRND